MQKNDSPGIGQVAPQNNPGVKHAAVKIYGAFHIPTANGKVFDREGHRLVLLPGTKGNL
jgi:hypothetical protein